MALADAHNDYEQTFKVLSNMVYSKPIALAALSQKTGIKLAELIRVCGRLEKEKIIRRSLENGNTYYILILEDYRDRIDELMGAEEEMDDTQRKELLARQNASNQNSRDAILKRRSMRASKGDEPEKVEPSVQIIKGPERISAMDLVAINRSTMANQRILRNKRQSESLPSVTPGQLLDSSSGINPSLSGGFRKTGMSSSSYKAIYVNKPVRGPQSSRSSFTSMPSGTYDSLCFDRSDTNFKQKEDIEPPSLGPIVPCKLAGSAASELKEDEVRRRLGFTDEDRVITILTPKPCHELWAACSALANAGGGTIILGMKRYGSGENANYFVKAIAKPEESIKTLVRAFNDRTYISDCPRDPEFIKIVQFGHKKLLSITIDPAQLSPAPLYTSHDSFCARDTAGCYMFKDGEIVHCAEDEVKQLWESKRLGACKPDWEQQDELIPVTMERKVKLNIPAGFDENVRPLSTNKCTYGQPLEYQFKYGKHRPYPGKLPPEREPVDLMEKVLAAQRAIQVNKQSSEKQIEPCRNVEMPTKENAKAAAVTPKEAVPASVLQGLLFAEDITVVAKETTKPECNKCAVVEEMDAPAAGSNLDMPPLLKDYDRAKLEEIAAPAVEHSRLPTIRLCEIAAELLQAVRLKPTELADLLNRKLVPVRDKVLPKIKESYDVQIVDGYYFIR